MAEVNSFNQKIMDEFRANAGKVETAPFSNLPMIIITTKGAKSGEPRPTPLVYSKDGDRYVIIASMGGAPKHPAWYLNLKANPELTVEVGSEKFQAKASIAEGAERDRLYAEQAKMMPQFNEYQAKTTRRIPVVVLKRA